MHLRFRDPRRSQVAPSRCQFRPRGPHWQRGLRWALAAMVQPRSGVALTPWPWETVSGLDLVGTWQRFTWPSHRKSVPAIPLPARRSCARVGRISAARRPPMRTWKPNSTRRSKPTVRRPGARRASPRRVSLRNSGVPECTGQCCRCRPSGPSGVESVAIAARRSVSGNLAGDGGVYRAMGFARLDVAFLLGKTKRPSMGPFRHEFSAWSRLATCAGLRTPAGRRRAGVRWSVPGSAESGRSGPAGWRSPGNTGPSPVGR